MPLSVISIWLGYTDICISVDIVRVSIGDSTRVSKACLAIVPFI
jgi:hypothetical protein